MKLELKFSKLKDISCRKKFQKKNVWCQREGQGLRDNGCIMSKYVNWADQCLSCLALICANVSSAKTMQSPDKKNSNNIYNQKKNDVVSARN